MAGIVAADELGVSSGSRRSWMTSSFRDPSDVFKRNVSEEDDEDSLKWAAIEKLSTSDRMTRGVLRQVDENGKVSSNEVDAWRLGVQEKKVLMDRILKVVEEDNERFLRRLRARIDQVGLELPKIEVRFENLAVEADAYAGSRAIPTLLNATINTLEGIAGFVKLSPTKKRINKILRGVSGILKPSRMTLLLGPPSSGKTTFLLSLAGKLDQKLRTSGKITHCGHELTEFVPQRTCAYISQHDLHNGEMTVRETLDFSGRCLGVGNRYEMLLELSRRERDAGIRPDPEIDAYMQATSMEGLKTNLATDYILKVLGLDICADILVGDEMRRGISGGQKKRLTTGEMLAGPARALFMDEISNGLDSSTTFQIVKFIRQMVHVMDGTVIISLLQPAPETFDLFDDIILLSEGQIVYQGPREKVLEFFEVMGFKCPDRKGIADFLQEVTSKKDQEQYWSFKKQPYRYITVSEFAQSFKLFYIGQELLEDARIPYDRSRAHPSMFAKKKYGISSWELLKACFSREWLLMKRNSFVYVFKTTQITIMSVIALTVFLRTKMPHETIADGGKFFGALFYSLVNVMFNGMAELAMTVDRLPVFYKQRDLLFYPPWAFGLSYWLLKIPLSLVESGIWVVLTYYPIGFAPAASRFFRQYLAFFFTHQMALSLFRFIAAAGRTMVNANTFGMFTLLIVYVLGGFLISKDDIQPWWIWGYWISPMMYGQNAVSINEFLDPRWNTPNNDSNIDAPTVGKAVLKSRGMFTDDRWYWISIGALMGFSFIFNVCFIFSLQYLNPLGNSQALILNEDVEDDSIKNLVSSPEKTSVMTESTKASMAAIFSDTIASSSVEGGNLKRIRTMNKQTRKGMVLPFQPLSLVFNHVNYYVDMPSEMKNERIEESRLQLLHDVSGAFRPGVLTALVGVSGAGKTTLMDVLAGRKTGGYIEGIINISGYRKKQETFARVCGYCEQNDIHSPHITVYESLIYSAWLRLAPEINKETRKMFVEEVMELVELNVLREALVGLPGVDGLSTEQRKRLTVAVELVANPSIIFMDEPTSGLDARAAAIVMRTVRNTVDTGRTVVCTIHQPSIDIFEAFDELLLMKRGGQVIYAGPLGHHSANLIEYFEEIPSIKKITEGCNPATWMLEITSSSVEAQLSLDFAEVYGSSSLYQKNQLLIEELSDPAPGSKDLSFSTKYAQSFITQWLVCFWKQHWSYWRDPQYNAIRFFTTIVTGVLFGTIFWNKFHKLNTEQEVFNILGALYGSVFFLGATNCNTVQPVIAIERAVFYREKAAGMYSPLSYAFAQVSIEIVYIALQSLLYTLIIYPMLGFSWQADKFLWFLYITFMGLAYFTLYGMMAVALTPGFKIAAIVSSFFFSLWNLFSGFLIFRPLIPIWWRWYYWATPLAWTIYGLAASQLGNLDNLIEIQGQSSKPLNKFLSDNLGYDHSFLGYVALAHLAFVALFFFVFAYSINYLNFQKR
ncbi:LOW QUALITY PROTEIN: pleiotropic drug resistance protein 2-like [Dioscorea cayenensis subsp. rotundata]|uniref:LOW QUALITY PROTEIN: pleiotropic drug resistance protein 2-like n=1 Tax=Dioscorea cayennensis subsp. rotundata TaxID=55577 RepID=A0AB40AV51_DIOCR|nr:LOW QUALITY PROTEIN: pleiotropic drug resistance protein 2-like [Dioscorea cayenensis subsp. rotundata]